MSKDNKMLSKDETMIKFCSAETPYAMNRGIVHVLLEIRDLLVELNNKYDKKTNNKIVRKAS